MILILKSTLIVTAYLIIRSICVKKISWRRVYTLGLLPACGLTAILFTSSNKDFWAWIILRCVNVCAKPFRGVHQLFTGAEGSKKDFSRQVVNLLNCSEGTIAKTIWLLGMIIVAGYYNLVFIRLVLMLIQNSKRVDVEAGTEFTVRETSSTRIPFLLWNEIFLPCGLTLREEQCQYVIKHEKQHYYQGDAIWNLWRILLSIVFWFHPLVWFFCRLSRNDSEFSCDEQITETMNHEQKEGYCTTLLSFATNIEYRKADSQEVSCLSGNLIHERIYTITKSTGQYKRKWILLMYSCMFLLFFTCFMVGTAWKKHCKEASYANVVEYPFE